MLNNWPKGTVEFMFCPFGGAKDACPRSVQLMHANLKLFLFIFLDRQVGFSLTLYHLKTGV